MRMEANDDDGTTAATQVAKQEVMKVAELPDDEFKKKILVWFKERGLLSDMRTYLRYQMITYLRDTQIGNALTQLIPKLYSAKTRAIHLLIAESLLHAQHIYTLSIFVTEVPFLNIFPEVTSIKSSCPLPAEHKPVFRFDKSDLSDILNALNIPSNCYERRKIENLYYSKTECSLLIVILHILVNKMFLCFTDSVDSSGDQMQDEVLEEGKSIVFKWNSCIYQILKKSISRGSNIYAVRDRLVRFFLIEFDRLRVESERKVQKAVEKQKELFASDLKVMEGQWQQERLNLETKHRAEVMVYKNSLAEQERLVKQLYSQLKETKNYTSAELQEKLQKETESKRNYKKSAQILRKECLKFLSELKYSQSLVEQKDGTIAELKTELAKMNLTHQTVIDDYQHQIKTTQTQNGALSEKLDAQTRLNTEKQRQYEEKVNTIASLQRELNEMKFKNKSLEQRWETLNLKSEKLKEQFERSFIVDLNESSSLEREQIGGSGENNRLGATNIKQTRSDCYMSYKRDFPVVVDPGKVNPINDILQETRQRLENLEAATKLVEESFKKANVRASIRFIDMLQSINENKLQTIDNDTYHVLHNNVFAENLKESTQNRFHLPAQEENSSIPPVKCSSKSVQVKCETVTNKNEIPDENLPTISPYFQNVQSHILTSLNKLETDFSEVSNDLKTLVKSSTKVNDDFMSNEILQKKSSWLLKVAELESTVLEPDDDLLPPGRSKFMDAASQPASLDSFSDALEAFDPEDCRQKFEISTVAVPRCVLSKLPGGSEDIIPRVVLSSNSINGDLIKDESSKKSVFYSTKFRSKFFDIIGKNTDYCMETEASGSDLKKPEKGKKSPKGDQDKKGSLQSPVRKIPNQSLETCISGPKVEKVTVPVENTAKMSAEQKNFQKNVLDRVEHIKTPTEEISISLPEAEKVIIPEQISSKQKSLQEKVLNRLEQIKTKTEETSVSVPQVEKMTIPETTSPKHKILQKNVLDRPQNIEEISVSVAEIEKVVIPEKISPKQKLLQEKVLDRLEQIKTHTEEISASVPEVGKVTTSEKTSPKQRSLQEKVLDRLEQIKTETDEILEALTDESKSTSNKTSLEVTSREITIENSGEKTDLQLNELKLSKILSEINELSHEKEVPAEENTSISEHLSDRATTVESSSSEKSAQILDFFANQIQVTDRKGRKKRPEKSANGSGLSKSPERLLNFFVGKTSPKASSAGDSLLEDLPKSRSNEPEYTIEPTTPENKVIENVINSAVAKIESASSETMKLTYSNRSSPGGSRPSSRSDSLGNRPRSTGSNDDEMLKQIEQSISIIKSVHDTLSSSSNKSQLSTCFDDANSNSDDFWK